MRQILLLVYILIFIPACSINDCGIDLKCFKEYAKTCSKTRINLIEEGNNVRLTIRGFNKNSCLVSFKIEEVSQDVKEEYPMESKVLIGKTLNCRNKYVNNEYINYIEEIFNLPTEFNKSCSGPIKDLMNGPLKEIIIKKIEKITKKI